MPDYGSVNNYKNCFVSCSRPNDLIFSTQIQEKGIWSYIKSAYRMKRISWKVQIQIWTGLKL